MSVYFNLSQTESMFETIGLTNEELKKQFIQLATDLRDEFNKEIQPISNEVTVALKMDVGMVGEKLSDINLNFAIGTTKTKPSDLDEFINFRLKRYTETIGGKYTKLFKEWIELVSKEFTK